MITLARLKEIIIIGECSGVLSNTTLIDITRNSIVFGSKQYETTWSNKLIINIGNGEYYWEISPELEDTFPDGGTEA